MLFGILKVSTSVTPGLKFDGKFFIDPFIKDIPEPFIYFIGHLDIKSEVICLELSALLALHTDCDPDELNVCTAKLFIPICLY
jgi:hypothetical protein